MSEELTGREMEKIARAFVKRSMRIGRKRRGYDAVRIVYNRTDPSCEKFAFKVEEECWRAGAHTLSLGYSSKRQKLKYVSSPEDSLSEMSPFAEAIARRADVLIFIGEEDEPMGEGTYCEGQTHRTNSGEASRDHRSEANEVGVLRLAYPWDGPRLRLPC